MLAYGHHGWSRAIMAGLRPTWLEYETPITDIYNFRAEIQGTEPEAEVKK